MARRGGTEDLELPLLVGVENDADPRREERGAEREFERPPRRVRTARKEKDQSPSRRRPPWYYWLLPVAALIAAFIFISAFHRVEAFLIADQRLHLQPPAEPGEDPPGLTYAGLHRANKAQLASIFEPDLGRSLYLFPVAERRRELLALDWIKEASVSRRWPNRVHVTLIERQPVAFVQIPTLNGAPAFKLIDADGYLMPIPSGERFNTLVVLTGMSAGDSEASRKIRVREALILQRELGELTGRLSEVDVRDPGNLRVTLRLDDAGVSLTLGNRNYRKRLENFLAHYEGIHQVKPDARLFDLRLDGRITAVEGTNGD